ncbi:hypothetical protein [Rubripirellula reticaptiva]|uniref:NolW-like domain-containing protein n=1 Tax=Rubripirellula reticaptiva TaxID=2528013 RepID=A0A5C6F805_9BACT|nr:hypothetical protein [Rubripirellula reticaptiva]TWU55909.1 hypothetical protein Poly59_22120 [Rubripirellula reticaptiva]
MQVRMTTLLLAVATFASATVVPTAWAQFDPFGDPAADPFGSSTVAPQQTPQPKQRSPRQTRSTDAIKTITAGHNINTHASGQPGIYVAIVNDSETEKRILAALKSETTQSFIDTPLNEAMRVLSQAHDIPIVIDQLALEEIGIASDVPINLSLKNVSLHSFLRLLLRANNLTYMIEDEVMQITTIERVEMNLGTRMYRLPASLIKKSDKVLVVLQSTIVPDTWAVLGGPSTATALDHVLIISTTKDVHIQVEDFLNTLIQTYGE